MPTNQNKNKEIKIITLNIINSYIKVMFMELQTVMRKFKNEIYQTMFVFSCRILIFHIAN